jgi:phosphate transport system permease protein
MGKLIPAKERLLKSSKDRLGGEFRGRVLVILCAVIMHVIYLVTGDRYDLNA